MFKYAKVINDNTKQCDVADYDNYDDMQKAYFESLGMILQDIEHAIDGSYYLKGFAPVAPEPTYAEKRIAEYPVICEQLDMIYWDKINNTNNWQEAISTIKAKYPKDETNSDNIDTLPNV